MSVVIAFHPGRSSFGHTWSSVKDVGVVSRVKRAIMVSEARLVRTVAS